jgi:ABC-2 type transport system permease protein
VILAVMAVVVFTASTLRFRRDLAPAGRRDEEEASGTGEPGAPTDEAAAGAAG